MDFGHWPCYALGPEDIERPKFKHGGGFYVIFSNGTDLRPLWKLIRYDTESGHLGHYSGFSPDKELICVHNSDDSDEYTKNMIEDRLYKLGVKNHMNMRYKSQMESYIERQGYYSFKEIDYSFCESSEDNSSDNSSQMSCDECIEEEEEEEGVDDSNDEISVEDSEIDSDEYSDDNDSDD